MTRHSWQRDRIVCFRKREQLGQRLGGGLCRNHLIRVPGTSRMSRVHRAGVKGLHFGV